MTRTFMILFFALGILLLAGSAVAEWPENGTIGLYLSEGDNDLSRAGVTKVGEAFELVVQIDTGVESIAVLFQMTELNLLYPGIFKVSTWIYNESIFDLGRNDIGEYVFPYGDQCAPAGEVVVTRVGYVDVTGELDDDIPLWIHGLEEDQIHKAELGSQPGYLACNTQDTWALAPEPWDDDSIDPTQIEGVTNTDGLLVLNPSLLVPNEGSSFSALKTRY